MCTSLRGTRDGPAARRRTAPLGACRVTAWRLPRRAAPCRPTRPWHRVIAVTMPGGAPRRPAMGRSHRAEVPRLAPNPLRRRNHEHHRRVGPWNRHRFHGRNRTRKSSRSCARPIAASFSRWPSFSCCGTSPTSCWRTTRTNSCPSRCGATSTSACSWACCSSSPPSASPPRTCHYSQPEARPEGHGDPRAPRSTGQAE